MSGEGKKSAGRTLFLAKFVVTRVGRTRTAIDNVPYKGPTIHEETSAAVSHVKSPLNAGGGTDIVV